MARRFPLQSIHMDSGTGLEVIEDWLRIPGPHESQKCHYIHGRPNSNVEARKSMRVRSRRRKTSQDCAQDRESTV